MPIQFATIFIFSAVLALSEAVFGQLVTYTSGQFFGPLFGPGMYLALSAGSFFAFKKFGNVKLPLCPYLIAAVLVLISMLGFAQLPKLAVAWGIIPFIMFGYILNSFYMKVSLRMLLIAASSGALIMLVILKCFTPESAARYYPIGITFALLVCSLLNKRTMLNIIAALVVAGMAAYAFWGQYTNPSAGMIRTTPTLYHGQKMRPTTMTPWIYTDLVMTKEGPYIITNGSRFSKIARAPRPPKDWASRQREFMDEAFVLNNAKSALFIGPAGGLNVRRAFAYDVQHIDAVDINPAVFDIMTTNEDVLDITRKLYLDPRVNRIVSEGRHFLETTTNKYDVIFIQGVRTGTMFSSIDASMLESYILTPQSVQSMWGHLTDNGIIVLEDYFDPASDDDVNSSYLKNIQNQLTSLLPITDWDKQSMYYIARKKVALEQDDFFRNVPNEVLLLSKQPILDKETVRDLIRPTKSDIEFVPLAPQKTIMPFAISDNRPFHTPMQFQNMLLVILGIASLGIIAFMTVLNKKTTEVSDKSGFMFMLGAGYILVFMGLLGRTHMILGQPALSSAVMLFSFYLFSMPTGIWATRMKFSSTFGAMCAATLWTAAIAIIFYFYQNEFIKITSLGLQIGIVVGMAALFCALTEIPYIALLASADNETTRGKQFTIGKVGTTFGVIIGFCIQILFGYTAVFAVGFCFLLGCLWYYRYPHFSKS